MRHAEEELFQQICERPWDVGLRLQFADWMDQHPDWSLSRFAGGECGRTAREIGLSLDSDHKIVFRQWAAFIRYQCRSPSDTVNRFSSQYMYELFDEVGEFDPYASDWLTGLPYLDGVSWIGATFKMGFVHNVGFQSPEAYEKYAFDIFSSTPIDMLSLEKLTSDSLSNILSSNLLRRLECLALFGDFADAGVCRLAECDHLQRLKSLMVMEHCCGDGGAIALANSPVLNQLQYLYFNDHRITDRGAMTLAQSTYLPNVISLSLGKLQRLSDRTVSQLKQRFRYLNGWPTVPEKG